MKWIILLLALCLASEAWAQESVICARPDVLWCDGFETHLNADGSYPNWAWNTGWDPDLFGTVRCLGGSTNPTRKDITLTVNGVEGTQPLGGSCSLYEHTVQDGDSQIFPDRNFTAQGTTTPIYTRFYIKFSNAYRWNNTGAKVFYLRADSGGFFRWAYMLGSESQGFDLGPFTDPGRFYIDVGAYHLTRLHYNAGPCASDVYCNAGKIVQGVWYAVELLLVPNSAKGVPNGSGKLWINDVLVSDYTGLDWRACPGTNTCGEPNTAEDSTANPNKIWLSTYVGGPTYPHPAETIWFDNVVVAKQKIGVPGLLTPLPPVILAPAVP